ncbi:recombinase family protein [Streptomyces sp. MS191]|uniref:recombinase family protein n=1 Tax=Streptomyces sp. ms191 TaxID=1827978 RepID=UPI00165090C8|nr:recombinase family protein [Streptomyces sp. ms191]
MSEHFDATTGRRLVRCFTYARISEDREGGGLGIERQVEDCETLARQLSTPQVEYRIVRVFQDNDLSAYSGKPRPDYLAMLEALKRGEGDCVLAWHTDRLHRSPMELEEYIDVCEPRRVDTRTARAGHLDLTTATGRMIARQLGVQARYEVERMIERQRRKRDQMAQRGQYFGGRRPFGYEPDGITPRALLCPACAADDGFRTVRLCLACGASGGFAGTHECRSCGQTEGFTVECFCECGTLAQLAPNSEATRVEQAADLVLAGASLNSIAARWNEEGVKTSTGASWAGAEVREMLLRPRNAGILKHRGKEAGRGGWKALLDEPKWRSAVAVLTDESRRTTPGNARRHLGSSLYVCGVHGATMKLASGNTMNHQRGLPSYSCRVSKHVMRRVDLLDAHVQAAVLDRVSRPDAVELLAAREEPVDVRGAQKDMREARATLTQLATALGDGSMDMLEWRAASGAAKKRLAAAEAVLATAVRANPVVGLVNAEDPEAAWNALDLGRQRAVIDFLMTVVVLPARRGRLPGGGYWDPEAVRLDWK